jgi:hypothetical protein
MRHFWGLACAAAFAAATGAIAQDGPLPEPDPREIVGPRIPVPEAAPDDLGAPATADAPDAAEPDDTPTPPEAAGEAPVEEPPAIDVTVSPADACHARLSDLDVVFTIEEPFTDGSCGIAMPVTVASVGGIALEPAPLLDCAAAEAAARWIGEVVVPTAEEIVGEPPVTLGQASAYVCRNRTSDRSLLSEHALGLALDVSSFVFAEAERIEVSPESVELPFLAAIRRAGCNYFTTLLGPGSDEDHDTHLHLDLSERSSGYRICQ